MVNPRKWLLAGVVMLAIAAAAGQEMLWRIDHVREGTPAATVAGISFEAFLLPERSEVPYGVGVFARASWNPLRSIGNTLVFAAYCGNDLVLTGDGANVVEIACTVQEGKPRLLIERFTGVQIRPRLATSGRG